MNKLLNIIKFFLIIILIIFNFYCINAWRQCVILENHIGHLVYMLLLFSLLLINLKDILKKENINKNKTYQMITIIVLIMMNFILWRTRFDTHLFFNDPDLISELEVYSNVLTFNSNLSSCDGGYISFLDSSMDYFRQNMIYFNIVFLLLFIYRKINLGAKKNN